MTRYEQLKSVVQQANPEIMELKFGCEIWFKLPNNLDRIDAVVLDYSEGHIRLWHKYMPNDIFRQTKRRIEQYGKILGRPIRLADVLLAIWKQNPANRTNVIVESSGQFLVTENGQKMLKEYWNLKDDNLDHQSEECKQFLIELLV